MAYGLIYTTTFDGFNSQQHTLEFYKKDYAGADSEIICGAGAVKQSWGPDQPKGAIKGCDIEIDLLNVQGTFPLSNFFSNEDDTFQVKFYIGADLKFFGYLVADDCQEVQDDFTHNLKLSATDGLGLLKELPLDSSEKAFQLLYTRTGVYLETLTPNQLFSSDLVSYFQIGDRLVISGTAVDGTYNIVDDSNTPSTKILAETVGTSGPQPGATVLIYRRVIEGRYSLGEILNFALSSTNLNINCNVYSQLRPVDYDRLLDDTYIDAGTWLNNEEFKDCWAVIEDIMSRLKATLFQANGVWNIIRWDELRQYEGLIPGHEYDDNFIYLGDIELDPAIAVGNGTDIEAGLTASIQRPYRFVKDTFNYRQPDNILRNASFSKLGPFISTESPGGGLTWNHYEMADWDVGHEWTTGGGAYIASSATRFIRVVINAVGEEVERYGVIEGNSGFDDYACAESFPIEVVPGDRIRYSFDFRTNVSQPGNVNNYFRLNILTTVNPVPRSVNNRYVNAQGKWLEITQLLYNTPVGSNTNQWQSVEVESEEIPVTGLLYIKLAQCVAGSSATKETHYKNLRFDIYRSVAGNTDVIGHIHNDLQVAAINNSADQEIPIDDSPSNSIAGTLFLESFTGPVQDRTQFWTRGADSEAYKLGQIKTVDELFARRTQRTQLEGNILRSDITPLSVILYSNMAGKNFITGGITVDHRNNTADGTLWEQYDEGEDDSDLVDYYRFKYIFKSKTR